MRRYRGMFLLALIFSPLVLAYWLVRGLYVLLRAFWREWERRHGRSRRSAERTLRAYQATASRQAQGAVREQARRAVNDALAAGDIDALQRAWRVLDANGGDYR